MKPPEGRKLYSYMTALSGIREGDLVRPCTDGVPLLSFADAQALLRKNLPKEVVLVGQKIQGDVEWMGLVEGVDFAEMVDLSEIFKSYNTSYGNYAYHSLIHQANIVLGDSHDASLEHCPELDARMSIQLWNKVVLSPRVVPRWQMALVQNRPAESVAKRLNWVLEGVCLSKFNKKFCSCGSPTG